MQHLIGGIPSKVIQKCLKLIEVASVIQSRIYDHSVNAAKGIVVISDFLEDSTFHCNELSNCSGQGSCVRPNVCSCNSGWTGPSCSIPSCSDVYNCGNHGTCVGPNTCEVKGLFSILSLSAIPHGLLLTASMLYATMLPTAPTMGLIS